MVSPLLPGHLYDFQADDARKLLGVQHQLVLLPQGAGKSIITLAAWEAHNAYTVVIVCPAIMKADWLAKVRKFSRENWNVGLMAPGRRIVVLSYEQLNTPERRAAVLAQVPLIDVLILDEGQRLKNPDTRIVQSIYGVRADGTGLVNIARHVWVLSGTLCPNHWGELYTHVRALFPKRLPTVRGAPMSYWNFLDRYTVWEPSQHNIRVLGNKNRDELRDMLKGIAIVRDRKELDKLLPPLTVDSTLLPPDFIDSTVHTALLKDPGAQRLAKMLGSGTATADELAAIADEPHMSTARRLLGELKAPAVAQYARQLLDEDPDTRILIFAWHRSVMKAIADDLCDLGTVPVIDGGIGEAMRAMHIAAFEGGQYRAMVLGIATAREGITLTAANRVLLAEASWRPSDNEQAIRRAHRIGQLRPVLAQYLAIQDTLDEVVMGVCARKSALLNEVTEGLT